MAEPVIISYARGLLEEFPGLPEGVVDVIPVDLVVATILAVAARGPDPAGPTVYHVGVGQRGTRSATASWSTSCATYFTEHPLYDNDGQPIVVPEWTFPGRGRVQRQLQRASTTLARGERLVAALPVRGRQAEIGRPPRGAAGPGRSGPLLRRALRRLRRVRGDLPGGPADRAGGVDRARRPGDDGTIDPAVIEWNAYVHGVHLPSVVEHARVKTTPGRRDGDARRDRGLKAVLAPERQLAVFDLENTLIASNVVESWAWLATRHLPTAERVSFTMAALREAPGLLALDRRDRGDFLRHFYRRYEDAPLDRLAGDAEELFASTAADESLPRRDPPGPRAPRPRAPHDADHRRPRLRRRPAAAAVRRGRVRHAWAPGRTGATRASSTMGPPTGEARALDDDGVLRRRGPVDGADRRLRRLGE